MFFGILVWEVETKKNNYENENRLFSMYLAYAQPDVNIILDKNVNMTECFSVSKPW